MLRACRALYPGKLHYLTTASARAPPLGRVTVERTQAIDIASVF
jgi:hypothetical protein